MSVTRVAAIVSVSTGLFLGAAILQAQEVRRIAPPSSLVWESCEEMHDSYVTRFEGAPGFGLSRMLQPPMMDRSGVLDLGRTRYGVESVELVGLLHRDPPVVYVPRLHDSGFDATISQSRSLTDFERDSLTAFRAGSGIASANGKDGTMRCIGALRAKDSCLRCHKAAKAGDLLGAFTYALKPLTQR